MTLIILGILVSPPGSSGRVVFYARSTVTGALSADSSVTRGMASRTEVTAPSAKSTVG